MRSNKFKFISFELLDTLYTIFFVFPRDRRTKPKLNEQYFVIASAYAMFPRLYRLRDSTFRETWDLGIQSRNINSVVVVLYSGHLVLMIPAEVIAYWGHCRVRYIIYLRDIMYLQRWWRPNCRDVWLYLVMISK